MKRISIIGIFLLALAVAGNAQNTGSPGTNTQTNQSKTYRVPLPNVSGSMVSLAMDRNAKFDIQGYDGNEIVITAKNYEPPPARAKGLKPLYGGGVDNTGVGLVVDKEPNSVTITRASLRDGDYMIKLPNKAGLKVDEVNWGGSEISITGMAGEVEVQSKTSEVNLKDVTGPITASSTSGNINVLFTTLNQQKPTSISDISGHIDITLPADTKANFHMKSISGNIFTDFDMNLKNKNKNDDMNMIGGGSTIESTTNGGGVDINLRDISGNIYVRKK